jgi:hypothetical protein
MEGLGVTALRRCNGVRPRCRGLRWCAPVRENAFNPTVGCEQNDVFAFVQYRGIRPEYGNGKASCVVVRVDAAGKYRADARLFSVETLHLSDDCRMPNEVIAGPEYLGVRRERLLNQTAHALPVQFRPDSRVREDNLLDGRQLGIHDA